ncbi:MAG TPA: tetratricopeptide repeat protein [Gammaproteobacteria bacterium]|nr:tetratricopeptide repeat protein [Gammaproteobacteria bacterium]
MRHLPNSLLAAFCAIAACAALAQTPTPTPTPKGTQVDIDSHALLAQIAFEDGRREDAAKEFLQAALLSDDPSFAERAARLAYDLGLTDTGLSAARRWLVLAPDDSRAHWFSGIFEARTGNADAATSEFGEFVSAVQAIGNAGSGLGLVVEALSSEPDTATATKIMTSLVERFPGTAEGDYGLAQLAMRSGDFDLALQHAESATKQRPDWLEAELLYARALLASGKSDQALALMDKLAQDHGEIEVQLQYAELLLSAGQTQKARMLLDKILDDNPGLPEASRALAFLAMSENDLDTAEKLFNDLRYQDRFRDESFYYLGRIAEQRDQPLQATRNYSRVTNGSHAVEAQLRAAQIMLKSMENGQGALRHLEEFGEANPRFKTDMLVARGQLLLEMKRSDDARSLLDSALAADPKDQTVQEAHAQLYVALAQDASSRGAYDDAEQLLEEGLAQHPNHRSLRYSQALLYQERGEMRKSARALEDLAKDYPDDPTVLNALGYLLTDQFDRYTEARGYIQKALAKEPDNPAIIDSMGWVLYKLGDYKGALDYLDRAYKLYSDPEVAAHLVSTKWALGRKQEALDLLRSALEKSPDDERLRELSKRIDK